MSFKKTKVVMLPTNEKAVIGFLTQKGKERGHLVHFDRPMPIILDSENQHLYFISDDEIKEGDWILEKGLSINKFPDYLTDIDDCKKIIASTDTSLVIDGKNTSGDIAWTYPLPRPSNSFIEKFVEAYNSVKPITEVMVEYQLDEDLALQQIKSDNPAFMTSAYIPKTNSKDNTITIKKVKEKTRT